MNCKHNNVEVGEGVLVSEFDIEVTVTCNGCGLGGTVIIKKDDIEWETPEDVEEEPED